jgi:hypothetical protein
MCDSLDDDRERSDQDGRGINSKGNITSPIHRPILRAITTGTPPWNPSQEEGERFSNGQATGKSMGEHGTGHIMVK